ncbi:MAG: DNA-binding protein, partial [Terriglobales bacterium]
MPRRAVVDREELFEAAESMTAQGKPVSALALLNTLGGGSLTTIYKYLAEWEAERPKIAPSAAGREIPDVVQNSFAGAWRVAAMEAAKETAAVKEQAAEEVKAANKQFSDALDAIKKLEADSEQDAAQIEALKVQAEQLQSKLILAGQDNAVLKGSIEHLKQESKKLVEYVERVEKAAEAERQLYHDEAAKMNADHSAKVDKATAEIERLHEELVISQKLATEIAKERDEAKFKFEHAEKQLTECNGRLQHFEQKHDAAMSERENAIKETAELKGHVQALK